MQFMILFSRHPDEAETPAIPARHSRGRSYFFRNTRNYAYFP
jgi:hypothetical protein